MIYYILRYLFILLISTMVLFCEEKESNSPELLVAKIGNEKISLKDFETSLLLNPQYSIRTPISVARRNQVKFLIEEKYYYLASELVDLPDEPVTKKRIKYIKDQEILREYINQEFVDKTVIDKKEIQRGLALMQTKLNARNYFFTNVDSAVDFRKKLIEFQQTNTKRLNSNSNDIFQKGAYLGWVTFGDLEFNIENELYSLNKGEISNVVKSKFGYHILIVNDIHNNLDIKNIPLNTLTFNVSEIIKKRKINTEIELIVNKISKGEKIKINNRIINNLSNYINNLMENREHKPTVLIPPIQNSELKNIEMNLENVLDEKIVIYANQSWTTQYFIERLKEMPPLHRPYLGTRNRLIQSILDLVKNDLLLEKAIEKGYEDNEEARLNYEKYTKEYLASYFKSLYHSKNFQHDFPKRYMVFKNALESVKIENKKNIIEANLFKGVSNSDSALTDAPIPVLLKNKYIW